MEIIFFTMKNFSKLQRRLSLGFREVYLRSKKAFWNNHTFQTLYKTTIYRENLYLTIADISLFLQTQYFLACDFGSFKNLIHFKLCTLLDHHGE